jgi:hypothetical protein
VFSFAAEQKLIHHHDDAKSLEQQQLFKHHLGVVVEGAQQLFMVSVFFIIFNCGCGGGVGGVVLRFMEQSSRIRTRSKISSN